uniref:Uncharacterized protein n=1 Tax=Cairina moschata TaxID=8855 RepID=A0A8C3CIG5_CAIMO
MSPCAGNDPCPGTRGAQDGIGAQGCAQGTRSCLGDGTNCLQGKGASWSGGQQGQGTARHSTAQDGSAQHGMARHGVAKEQGWHGTARHGTARHGMARHGTARHLWVGFGGDMRGSGRRCRGSGGVEGAPGTRSPSSSAAGSQPR